MLNAQPIQGLVEFCWFSSKNLSLEIFCKKISEFFKFSACNSRKTMKICKRKVTIMVTLLQKKPIKLQGWKTFDCSDKSLSEIWKKRQINRRPGSQVILIFFKVHFPRWRSSSIAPTVYLKKQGPKVGSINKFRDRTKTLSMAVCLFRDKTNHVLQRWNIMGRINAGI